MNHRTPHHRHRGAGTPPVIAAGVVQLARTIVVRPTVALMSAGAVRRVLFWVSAVYGLLWVSARVGGVVGLALGMSVMWAVSRRRARRTAPPTDDDWRRASVFIVAFLADHVDPAAFAERVRVNADNPDWGRPATLARRAAEWVDDASQSAHAVAWVEGLHRAEDGTGSGRPGWLAARHAQGDRLIDPLRPARPGWFARLRGPRAMSPVTPEPVNL